MANLRTSHVATQVIGIPQYVPVTSVAAQVVGDRKGASLYKICVEVLADKKTHEGSGSALLGGEAGFFMGLITEGEFYEEEGSGGIIATGVATFQDLHIGSGGTEVGGVAGYYREHVSAVIAQILGTKHVSELSTFAAEVLGDLVTDEATGSTLLGGEAVNTIGSTAGEIYENFGSGGIVTAGVATFQDLHIGSGGTEVGGAAGYYQERVSTVIAQIIGTKSVSELSTFAAEVLGDLVTDEATGSALLGGTSIPSGSQSASSSGGAELGGEAYSEVIQVLVEGGVEVGGDSVIDQIFSTIGEGGAEAGGESDYGNSFTEIAGGSIEASGESANTYIFVNDGTNGAEINGDSEVGGITSAIGLGGAEVGGNNEGFIIFNKVTSGGSVAGGNTPFVSSYEDIANGGSEIGGVSETFVFRTLTATDGAEIGGEGELGGSTAVDGSGGTEMGGNAANTVVYSQTGTSGVFVGGYALRSTFDIIEELSGGIESGGQQTNFLIFYPTSNGGSEIGGSAEVGQTYASINASGGIQAGGRESQTVYIQIPDIDGGVEAGGNSLIGREFFEIAAGGVEGGGVGQFTRIIDGITLTGGAVLNGQSINNSYTNHEGVNGGLLSGFANVFKISSLVSLGSIEVGGNAFTGREFFENTSGGSELDGIGVQTLYSENRSSGGVVTAGNATKIDFNVLVALGGAVLGGLSEQTLNINSITNTGGLEIGGVSPAGFLMEELALGGAEVSGLHAQTVFFVISGISGAEVGGSISKTGVINTFAEGGVEIAGIADNFNSYSEFGLSGGLVAGTGPEQAFKNPSVTGIGLLASGLSLSIKFTDNIGQGGSTLAGIGLNVLNINSIETQGGLESAGDGNDVPWIFSQVNIVGLMSRGLVNISGELTAEDVERTTVIGAAIPVIVYQKGPMFKELTETLSNQGLSRWELLRRKILSNEKPEGGNI